MAMFLRIFLLGGGASGGPTDTGALTLYGDPCTFNGDQFVA